MVKGWEEFTHELTDTEKNLIYPKFVAAWNKRLDEQKISMKDMLIGMNDWIEKQKILNKRGNLLVLKGPRLRKIIHAARVKGDLPTLIATSDGYFKSTDLDKIEAFIESCRQRANSFSEVANAMLVHNNLVKQNTTRNERSIHN